MNIAYFLYPIAHVKRKKEKVDVGSNVVQLTIFVSKFLHFLLLQFIIFYFDLIWKSIEWNACQLFLIYTKSLFASHADTHAHPTY